MSDLINYFLNNYDILFGFTAEHVQLVGIAIIIAILIGVPVGIYITTNEELAETILQITSIIMTIPSIALFGIMIPILSIINQGIGFLPALIALVLYSQLPIIRNTYTAINDVDPNIRDAAIGIGMTTFQRLRKVEIPNAMPLIMAGIRTATVLNIGIGAIAAFIGSGGLGVLINQGISRSNSTMILAGAIAVSVLAIIADLFLKYVQKRFTPKGLNS
ncbi:ABC transporter permease [Aquibacillus sp. 3ASR75-11]|uniref:ABC transporter permease n=1 Tax=Terrihalobacillus insolitus TaxID=2950438 RepID=A0A9X3WN87_9BACI|nr:ABC transporter permease [Terrihalobacillus insolitus]MDC3412160.1 ABC transporter permease [Terrihalobacillus insolitus]MDC3423147.1 ABC transporter permease [Terrihalobacillus insolitus]